MSETDIDVFYYSCYIIEDILKIGITTLNYSQWNEEIFKYFFNKENANKKVLFCVDENVIAEIGLNNNMPEKDSLFDFCKSVSEKILYQNKNKNWKIKLSNFNISIQNNIPSQTALIAFYILAASKMGEDKICGKSNISDRNYYIKLAQLSEDVGYKNIEKAHCSNDKEIYFKLFNDFEKFVNSKIDEYGTIEFIPLFKKKERKREDWVGIPIFQSMISHLDKAYLANYFSKIYTKNNIVSLDNLKVSKFWNKFSSVFRNISNNEEYRLILEEHLINLYEDWEADPCTYDIQANKKIKKNVFKFAKILYLYQKEYDDYNFYEVFKNESEIKILKIDDNNIFEKYNSNDYYFKEIDKKDISLFNKQYHNHESIKFYNIRNENFILLKKSDEFEDYFIETDKAEVGDVISIIAEPCFFKIYYNEIKKVINKDFDLMLNEITPIKYLLENVQAFEESSLLNIRNIDRCKFSNGLKQGNTKKYLKGAEPIVTFPTKRNQTTMQICIDNNTENLNDNTIDFRKYNLSVGEHKICYSGKEDSFQIVDEIENIDNKNVNIYNYLENFKLKKTAEYRGTIKNLINGCFIENLEILSDNYIVTNTQKRNYINYIINAIKKKQMNNKNTDKKIKDNIELKYLKELED